jgi:cytoskeletal protein CcmA (bactofilin family)
MTHLTTATAAEVLSEIRAEVAFYSGMVESNILNNAQPEIISQSIENLAVARNELEIAGHVATSMITPVESPGGISCDDNPAFKF